MNPRTAPRAWLALIVATAGCGAAAPTTSAQAAPRAQAAASAQAAPSAGGNPAAAPAATDERAAEDARAAPWPAAEPAAAKRPPPGKPRAPAVAQAMVDAHNRVRAKHCAGALTWSAKLAEVAQQWANSLRDKRCSFGHSGGSYGENLAAGSSGLLTPESVVAMWYDEIAKYKFPNGGFSMATGHFTQVVWRGTTQVGCGVSHCNNMDIWVCEYDPPGNWEGQYRENVLPLGCR